MVRLPLSVAQALVLRLVIDVAARIVSDVNDPGRHTGDTVGDARAVREVAPGGAGLRVRGLRGADRLLLLSLVEAAAASGDESRGGENGEGCECGEANRYSSFAISIASTSAPARRYCLRRSPSTWYPSFA